MPKSEDNEVKSDPYTEVQRLLKEIDNTINNFTIAGPVSGSIKDGYVIGNIDDQVSGEV